MISRHLLLGLTLAATAAAALWLPSPQQAEVVQAAPRLASPPSGGIAKPVATQPPHVLALRPREQADDGSDNAFGVHRWNPPPRAVTTHSTVTNVIAATVVPPQAPAAPFKVIGRYEESGRQGMFLEHQQATLVARAGDQLTADWKVESIDAGRLVLLYVPLSQKQVLEWASP